jgi:hypothetical protein
MLFSVHSSGMERLEVAFKLTLRNFKTKDPDAIVFSLSITDLISESL